MQCEKLQCQGSRDLGMSQLSNLGCLMGLKGERLALDFSSVRSLIQYCIIVGILMFHQAIHMP